MAFVGRPKKFENNEQLIAFFIDYETFCNDNKKPLTVSGFCAFLGISRDTLFNYGKDEQFSDTIKRVKTHIEADKMEGALMYKYNPTIVIFDLKNNHDWKDKTEVDSNLSGNINQNHKVSLSDMTDEQLRKLAELQDSLKK